MADNMEVDTPDFKALFEQTKLELEKQRLELEKELEKERQEKEKERHEKEKERHEKERILQTRETKERATVYLDKERHAWQLQKRQARHFPEGWDDVCAISKETIAKLLQTLVNSRLVLLRAPPGSGKTTMAETLGVHCAEVGYSVYIITLLGYSPNDHKSVDDYFRSYWTVHQNVDISTTFSAIRERALQLKAQDKPLILILDEAQIWYGMDHFWNQVKDTSNILLFCFSAFGHRGEIDGIGTPLEIKKFLGFPELQLSEHQIQEIAQKIKRDYSWSLHLSALKLLHSRTNGHARLIREVLVKFSERDQYNTEQEQIDFLFSQEFFYHLASTRVFYGVQNMYEEMEKKLGIKKLEFLDTLLETYRGSKPVVIEEPKKRAAMIKFGAFYQDDIHPQYLYILCPTAFDILLTKQLTTGKLKPADNYDSFEEFLITTIQRMKRTHLKHASANPEAKLSEDFLQKEFYRAAVSVLSEVQPPYTIQTNAGIKDTEDIKGNCDFFIDSGLRWAVELVFQGHKIDEHVNRFHPQSGLYASLNAKFDAVIDFRVPSTGKAILLPKKTGDLHRRLYWAVVYSDDFCTATIHFPPLRAGKERDPHETIKVIELQKLQG